MSKELFNNVKRCLETLGYDIVEEEYYQNIYEWKAWFESYVKKFHKYKMYNGYDYVDKERYTLSMPKRACEEWASLLYNDNTFITIDDNLQGTLNDILEKNRFEERFSELLELTFAFGTGATVVFEENKQTRIDYINALMIFPIEVRNKEIVSCAFGSVVNGNYYLNIHKKENEGYRIINKVFTIANKKVKEVSTEDLAEEHYSPVKMFQIYRPNITNNKNLFTGFGLSCFANAISQNKTCDLAYDSFSNEFELGKKRIFIGTDLLTTKTLLNEKGEQVETPIFDREQTEFFALPTEDNEELFKEVNMELRVTEHIEGIQTALNLFSDACGLGPDRFVFKDGQVYTNTQQVISTNSKVYKNIRKHEKMLFSSMSDLIRAILYSSSHSEYTSDISIDFDDSIINDTESLKRQAMLEFNADLIDAIQYYMDVYGMTEEQAIKFRDKIQSRNEVDEDEPPVEE